MLEFTPPLYTFATISIVALGLLGISLLLSLKIKSLMGTGKDTAPIKILMTVIVTNGILGAYSATAIYWKYVHNYINYVRITDIVLLAISIILVTSIYKVYKDYKNLVKKHEPES